MKYSDFFRKERQKMNRGILFKGFSSNKNGKQIITLGGKDIRGDWIEWNIFDGIKTRGLLLLNTVCQYTGKTDLFNNEIWEGDLVKGAGTHVLVVSWDDENARFEANILDPKSVAHTDDDYDDYAEACDFDHLSLIGDKFNTRSMEE